ncbi:MAG: hypothetical protein M1837_005825 [Sclerophora amabilis]|nr:MAG: hypothetical protein M1837_005825 [Sclerophora amabilis]
MAALTPRVGNSYPLPASFASQTPIRPGTYPGFNRNGFHHRRSGPLLPGYIKPLPPRIVSEDVAYLENKGALSIPETGLRNELLRAYVEFVHGYMPLLDLNDFLKIVDMGNGATGTLSLLLFQAVMFVGSAFVDLRHLQNAGFPTRKAARRAFFQRARVGLSLVSSVGLLLTSRQLLYDFDYEIDRISLIQALLLMTYWYETPNDQKDTWHWMGVAISLAHTIGLHRNPEKSDMDSKRQSLWKRIWWSCYMRDRLVALGMRRPTRIKSEDFDVPMLTVDDFDLEALPDHVSCISPDCAIARNVAQQHQLAGLCVEKAKLSLCISHVLSAQYSVLNNNQGALTPEGNTQTTMMLLPKKADAETCDVQECDLELTNWIHGLPDFAAYQSCKGQESPVEDGHVLTVHRALLHMVYFTTSSALHRPQVLPSHPATWPARKQDSALQEISRKKVRTAATEITRIAQNLHDLDLVRYLPTTGVTVLLPAVIIHLLDIKSPKEEIRNSSLQGFYQCMQVMQRLRETYASADFATQFLEAAICKADIQVAPKAGSTKQHRIFNIAGLVDAGRQRAGMDVNSQLTPPPETHATLPTTVPSAATQPNGGDEAMLSKLTNFLASTPPSSDESSSATSDSHLPLDDLFPSSSLHNTADKTNHKVQDFTSNEAFERDFDSLIDFDAAAGVDDNLLSAFADGSEAMIGVHGESSGFALDMDWMNGMGDEGQQN